MHLIKFADLKEAPWANGGGITREIVAHRRGHGFIWRISMADVTDDSAFSNFEGFKRILTVIAGEGMELISENNTLQAAYGIPVHFDGGLSIWAKLKNGFLRDLNVIYDPLSCVCSVEIARGFQQLNIEVATHELCLVHCFEGYCKVKGEVLLQQGDSVLAPEGCFDVLSDQVANIAIIKIKVFSSSAH